MISQQSSVYPNMMNNQQPNMYNPTNVIRTPNQTPMSVSNPQWPSNQTLNIVRQPQTAYNSVKFLFFFSKYLIRFYSLLFFLSIFKMMSQDPQQHFMQQQHQQQQQQQQQQQYQ